MLLNVGSGGGAAAVPTGGAAGGGAGEGTAEEAKEEEKEEGKHIYSAISLVCISTNTNYLDREGGVGRGHGPWSFRLEAAVACT